MCDGFFSGGEKVATVGGEKARCDVDKLSFVFGSSQSIFLKTVNCRNKNNSCFNTVCSPLCGLKHLWIGRNMHREHIHKCHMSPDTENREKAVHVPKTEQVKI